MKQNKKDGINFSKADLAKILFDGKNTKNEVKLLVFSIIVVLLAMCFFDGVN